MSYLCTNHTHCVYEQVKGSDENSLESAIIQHKDSGGGGESADSASSRLSIPGQVSILGWTQVMGVIKANHVCVCLD